MAILENTFLGIRGDEILKERGLTKTEFASRVGILPQNVKKYLKTTDIIHLSKIANALDVSLEYLLYGPEKENVKGYLEINGRVVRIFSKKDLMRVVEEI